MFAVPLKSLKRWIKVGPERKKGKSHNIILNIGGGRKIRDPDMEKKLYSWYTQLKSNNTPVTPKMIKNKALAITKFSDFIASKGWLEKFKRKFNLELSRENKIEIKKQLLASKSLIQKPAINLSFTSGSNTATNANTPELK